MPVSVYQIFGKKGNFSIAPNPFRGLSAFGIDEYWIPTSSLFVIRLLSLYLPPSVSPILLKATVTLKPSETLQERTSGVGSHPGACAFYVSVSSTPLSLFFSQ